MSESLEAAVATASIVLLFLVGAGLPAPLRRPPWRHRADGDARDVAHAWVVTSFGHSTDHGSVRPLASHNGTPSK